MGKNSNTSTTTTAPANASITDTTNKLLGGINSAYDKGPSVFNESLYSGLGGTTKDGLNALIGSANNSAYRYGVNSGINYSSGLIGDGYGEGQESNVNAVNNVASQFQGMANTAQNPSLTEQQLLKTAQGGSFGQSDPGYAAMRDNLSSDIMGEVGSSFASNGRFGGGAYVDKATDSLTSGLGALDYTNHQNDIARQERALSSIEGQRQQGFANRSNNLLNAASTAQAGFGLQQQGVNNVFAAQQSLPGLYAASQQPASTLLSAGAIQDADAQTALQGRYDLSTRQGNAQSDYLAKLTSILNGNAAASGSTTTQTTPQAPWWQQALGGAAVGAGIYGAFK